MVYIFRANRRYERENYTAGKNELDIAFQTEELRQECINKNIAKKKFGATVADRLLNRLADLRAAESVDDLVVGLQSQISGEAGNTRVLELAEGYELVFVAHHLNAPLLADNRVDWTRVSRVKIVSIKKGAIS